MRIKLIGGGFAGALLAALSACGSSQAPGGALTVALNTGSTAFGRVVSEPAGIDCPGRCAAPFDAGTELRLEAVDTDEGVFDGWDAPCGDAPVCAFTVERAMAVGVHFAAAPRGPGGQWHGGDTHVHTDHSSDGSLPRQIDQSNAGNVSAADQIRFAETRGLEFLSLSDHRTWDQHYNPEWESSRLLLIAAEEANGRPHATVHGSVERILQRAGTDLHALQQSIWDAHAQGAAWVTAHPDRDNTESDGTPRVTASAVGVDAVEMWNIARSASANTDYIEDRWNRGYRFGIVAASDNHFRELRALSGPGRPTTHLLLRAVAEREVVEALRAGHSAVASRGLGPTMRLRASVGDDDVWRYLGGDELTVPAGTPVRLRIEVDGGGGGLVQVYRNPGRQAGPLATFVPTPGEDVFTLDFEAEDTPAWIRAELRGLDMPDSPLITVEDLLDDLASLDIPALLESIVSLPGQLRAATSALFIAPRAVEPEPETPLPAAIETDDGARYVLGSRLAWSGFPDVAEGRGVAHIVAEAHVAGGSRVVYRRIDGDGRMQPLRNLAPASSSARFPRVAARGDEVWVVWQDERAGQVPRRPAIYARRSGDAGDTWDEEILLRAVEGRAERPVVALDADNRPVVAWQETRAGRPFDVWAQIPGADPEPSNLSGADKAFHPQNDNDTRSARWPASVYPAIAVADDGRIAVAWQDNRADPDPLFTGRAGRPEGTSPDDWNMHSAIRQGGAWQLLPPVGDALQADRFPDIAWDATGALHALWEGQNLSQSGTTSRIEGSRWNGDGWAQVAVLAAGDDFSAQRPRLARAEDGGLRAAWFDGRAEDWRWGVATARFTGAGWQEDGLIPAPGINTWPALAETALVFAATRNVRRMQRDMTQQIFVIAP